MAIGATFTAADDAEDTCLFGSIEQGLGETKATIAVLRTGNLQGITAQQLSKVWCISESQAAKTIQRLTQYMPTNYNTTLSREFGTNDRFLRYHRIHSVFFTDTFQVTDKARSR